MTVSKFRSILRDLSSSRSFSFINSQTD